MTKEEFNNLKKGDIIYRDSFALVEQIKGELIVTAKDTDIGHIEIETPNKERWTACYSHFRTTKKKLKKDDDIVTLKITKTIKGLTRKEAKELGIDASDGGSEENGIDWFVKYKIKRINNGIT